MSDVLISNVPLWLVNDFMYLFWWKQEVNLKGKPNIFSDCLWSCPWTQCKMGYQGSIGNGQLVSNMIRTSGVLQPVSLQKPHRTSIITCLKRRRVKSNPCDINEILMSKNVISKTAQNMFWKLMISLEGFKVSFKAEDESDHTCDTATFFKIVWYAN